MGKLIDIVLPWNSFFQIKDEFEQKKVKYLKITSDFCTKRIYVASPIHLLLLYCALLQNLVI